MEDCLTTNFKFVDEDSSSKYACDVCLKISTQALSTQCCGATYCKRCAEIAESSATIQAEEVNTESREVQSNPSASVCTKCKNDKLELVCDALFQDCISKLQVQCLKAGCGWMGNFEDAESHMKEPHDTEDELYDNEFLLEGEPIEDQSSPAEQQSSTPSPHTTSDKDVSEEKTQQPPHAKDITDDEVQHSSSSISQLQEQSSTTSSTSERENVCLRFYSSTHSGDFRDLSTSEKLLYLFGFIGAVLWVLCALPILIISLMNSIRRVTRGNASFAPSCDDYSVGLLWLVVLAHLIVIPFVVFWLSKGCCKRCRGKRIKRAATSSLCLLILLYAVIVAGFSASVLVYLNETSNSNSGNATSDMSGSGGNTSGDYMSGASGESVTGGGGDGGECGEEGSGWSGSGSGDRNITSCNNRSMNETKQEEKDCVEVTSEVFILAVAFLGLLFVFVMAVSCLLAYECSHNGLCYTRSFYDPTVMVFENETSFSAGRSRDT